MMAAPGTPCQGNRASCPRALGWVCWFRVAGPCVQAVHVSRWWSRLGTARLICMWYSWVPCMPIWWGRTPALPDKVASLSSEALNSDAWSCYLVCVSWVMVTGICILGDLSHGVWVPAVGLHTSVCGLGALGQGCSLHFPSREDSFKMVGSLLSRGGNRQAKNLLCQELRNLLTSIPTDRCSPTLICMHTFPCTHSPNHTLILTQFCRCHVGP